MTAPTVASPTICTIDDDQCFNSILKDALVSESYQVVSFASVQSFLEWHADPKNNCDLIVTDLNMPLLSGYDLCKEIRVHQKSARIPIIVMTGIEQTEGKVLSLKYGADDLIQKPFRQNELLAKIQSLLSIRTREIALVNNMSRFVSPNIAKLLLSNHNHVVLTPHQADITVLFIDIRRFTAFSETHDPAEVMDVLNKYYNTVGRLMEKHDATLGSMAGDGFMLFLNDPHPIKNHKDAGVRLALELRDELAKLRLQWQGKGYDIDFGMGLAEGIATIGGIGFEQFWQYTVIGYVANFASRICALADKGEILVSHRFLSQLKSDRFQLNSLGPMSLKGIHKPVDVHNVVSQEIITVEEQL